MSLKQETFQKQLKNVMKFARNWQKISIFVKRLCTFNRFYSN